MPCARKVENHRTKMSEHFSNSSEQMWSLICSKHARCNVTLLRAKENVQLIVLTTTGWSLTLKGLCLQLELERGSLFMQLLFLDTSCLHTSCKIQGLSVTNVQIAEPNEFRKRCVLSVVPPSARSRISYMHQMLYNNYYWLIFHHNCKKCLLNWLNVSSDFGFVSWTVWNVWNNNK